MARNVQKQGSGAKSSGNQKPAKSTGKRREPTPKRRVDWEANDQLIKESFYELLRLRKRAPKISEISERTGASSATISRVAQWLRYGRDGYRLVIDRARRRGRAAG